ncbi:MAG: methyltransferase [Promethearchaeota archaeon]
MPSMEKDHYFTKKPKTHLKVHKLFESIRSHTLNLQTASGVFSPENIDKGTRILIENLMLPKSYPGMNLLEIGAGYGPICIWLEKEYRFQNQMNEEHPPIPNIYASEVNERGVWLLKRNIISNNCKKIKVLKGDFQDHFETLKKEGVHFQAVYTNPPLKTGHDVMLDLFEQSMELLAPNGFIQYVHMKKLGAAGFLKKLQILRPDWFFTTVRKKGGYHVILVSPTEYKIESKPTSGYF